MLTMDETYLSYSFNTKCGDIFVSDCQTKFINICLFCNESYLNNAEFTEHFQNTHSTKRVNSSDNYDITLQSIDAISLTDLIEEVPYELKDEDAVSDTENVYELELNESEPESLNKSGNSIDHKQTVYKIKMHSDSDFDVETDANISKNASESIELEQTEEINCPYPDFESDSNNENYDGENSVGSKINDPLERLNGRQFSRAFIEALLDKYKNLPILWDQSNVDYYSKNKENAFAELIKIYKTFNLDADKDIVQRKLQSLRNSFRKELKWKITVEAKGKKHVPKLKYFKEMSFLLGSDETNNEKTDDSYSSDDDNDDNSKIRVDGRVQNIKFVKEFIATVRELPSLWNPDDTHYFKQDKKKALQILVNKYKEYDSTSVVDCEFVDTKWQTLCSVFRKEFNKHQIAKAKGDTYNSTFQYFNEMMFLSPIFEKMEYDDDGSDCVKKKEISNSVKMFHCDRCSRTFTIECRFKYHQMSHEGIFKCDICNSQYEKLFDLLRHKKIHELEMSYECETCGKKFSRKTTLRLHSQLHTDEKPFECDYCGRKFATKGNYLVHVQRHESITKFKCDICSKGFVTSTELRAHSFTHKTIKQYICELCGKDFRQKICFQNHVRKIHGTAEPQYKCNLCDKLYYTSKTLNKHKAGHNKERKHICEKCGAKFHTRYNYTLHMRSHMTVKLFVCEFCQKGFNQASVLRNHIKKKHD